VLVLNGKTGTQKKPGGTRGFENAADSRGNISHVDGVGTAGGGERRKSSSHQGKKGGYEKRKECGKKEGEGGRPKYFFTKNLSNRASQYHANEDGKNHKGTLTFFRNFQAKEEERYLYSGGARDPARKLPCLKESPSERDRGRWENKKKG